ncbi:MAG: DUF4331 domain-containing protein [Planctomycetes bacterium]|nr:DUF4331 domain-containing protein [Planctomycetota bacterium]
MLRIVSTRSTAFAVAALALASSVPASSSVRSSHREAPLITEMPKVDATDFYLFTSYEPGRSDYVTAIANYIPLQDPYGGPNYFTMDPQARYEIHIDNNGDARADLTFRFRFTNTLRDVKLPIGPTGQERLVSVPLRNVGPILAPNDGTINEIESYTIELVNAAGQVTKLRNAATGATTFAKPLDYIGTKSFPNYQAYAAAHTYDVDLGNGQTARMFVGQRKDPFVVNLGEAFDLINLNPLGPVNGEADLLADANVTSLILELPKSFVVTAQQPIIGGWTSASLPRNRVLKGLPSYAQPTSESGDFVQVSRLASPLVNELVIGLKDKDRFNASRPNDDVQFATYVTHPTLPALIEVLFGVSAPTLFPRTDLVQVFVTGVPGLTENGSFGEMLRLNTGIAPTPLAQQSNLGVLGGDLAGYPNGRRPGDDVVDMSLRVVMGVLLPQNVAPAGQLPYTDGAYVDATYFDPSFPYVRTPLPGAQ